MGMTVELPLLHKQHDHYHGFAEELHRNPQRNNRFNQRVNQFGPPPPPPARRRPNNNRNNNRNNRQFNNNNNNNPRPATRRPARPASNNFRATAANARDSTGNEIYPGCN